MMRTRWMTALGAARVTLLLVIAVSPLTAQGRDDVAVCGTDAPGAAGITITLRETPIADALAQLAARSGVRLVYSRDLLPSARRVTLRCAATSVEYALREILAGTGLAATLRPGGLVVIAPASAGVSASNDGVPLARADRPLELPLVRTIADIDRAALRTAALPPPNPGGARTIVTAADIAASGVVQLGEALRTLVPGLAVWETGMPGAGLRIAAVRGASSTGGPSLKVYLDGVEMASGASLAALDARDIDRLELLRGPASSALHGADAMDGVLLVTTRAARDGPAGRMRVQGALRTGAAATGFADAPAPLADAAVTIEQRIPLGDSRDSAYQSAGVAWAATVNASHAGAVTPTALADAGAARATLRGWRPGLSAEFTARVAASRASPALRAADPLEIGLPRVPDRDSPSAADSFDFTAARERLAQGTLGLVIRGQGRRVAQALTLGVDQMRTATDSGGTIVRAAPDSARWAWPGTTTRLGARWAAQVALHDTPETALSLAVGAEATRLHQVGPLTSAVGAAGRDTALARDLAAATLALTARHGGAFTWHVGLRAERNDAVGSDVGIAGLPTAGVAWERALRRGTRLRLRAGAGTAVRAPAPLTTVARSTPLVEQRANPALGLERQRGGEVSVEVVGSDGASIAVTRYAQRTDGLLQLVTLGTSGDSVARRIVQYQQVGRIRSDGWEFTARAAPAGWRLQGSLTLMPSRVAALDARYTGLLAVGDQMLDAPVRSGALTVGRSLGRTTFAAGITYTGMWRAIDWRCTVAQGGFGRCAADGPPRLFPGIVRPWLSLSQPIGTRLALQLRADNLGGTQRGEGNAVLVAPGRTVLLGLTVRP